MLKSSIMFFTYPTGLRSSRIAVIKILGFKASLYTLKNYCGPPKSFYVAIILIIPLKWVPRNICPFSSQWWCHTDYASSGKLLGIFVSAWTWKRKEKLIIRKVVSTLLGPRRVPWTTLWELRLQLKHFVKEPSDSAVWLRKRRIWEE